MGYSISLLALQCADPGAALSHLKVERTGEFCEYADAPLSGYALPSGWYLVVDSRRRADSLLHPDVLGVLSRKCPVIACAIEEHVMYTSAEQWDRGSMVWRALHVGENGPIHLETEGTVPPSFQAICATHVADQQAEGGAEADVDHYFDIPLMVAKEIIGFKHDEESPGVDYARFDLLRELSEAARQPQSRPWWRFWA
jgi:hypothetical protein